MATIENPRLELVEHDHRRKTATIRVSYRVRLSAVERNMTSLRFKEKIQIRGADSPDPDDTLYDFPTVTFPTEADAVVTRSRTQTIGDEVLDEDGWPRPTDEIYAKICISPLLPVGDCANSNRVEHEF